MTDSVRDTIEGWYIRYAHQAFQLRTWDLIECVVDSPSADVLLYKQSRQEGGSTALRVLGGFYAMHMGVNVMMVYPRYHMAMFGWKTAKTLFSDWHVTAPGLSMTPPHGQGMLTFTGVDQIIQLLKGREWWGGFFDEAMVHEDNLHTFRQTIQYR